MSQNLPTGPYRQKSSQKEFNFLKQAFEILARELISELDRQGYEPHRYIKQQTKEVSVLFSQKEVGKTPYQYCQETPHLIQLLKAYEALPKILLEDHNKLKDRIQEGKELLESLQNSIAFMLNKQPNSDILVEYYKKYNMKNSQEYLKMIKSLEILLKDNEKLENEVNKMKDQVVYESSKNQEKDRMKQSLEEVLRSAFVDMKGSEDDLTSAKYKYQKIIEHLIKIQTQIKQLYNSSNQDQKSIKYDLPLQEKNKRLAQIQQELSHLQEAIQTYEDNFMEEQRNQANTHQIQAEKVGQLQREIQTLEQEQLNLYQENQELKDKMFEKETSRNDVFAGKISYEYEVVSNNVSELQKMIQTNQKLLAEQNDEIFQLSGAKTKLEKQLLSAKTSYIGFQDDKIEQERKKKRISQSDYEEAIEERKEELQRVYKDLEAAQKKKSNKSYEFQKAKEQLHDLQINQQQESNTNVDLKKQDIQNQNEVNEKLKSLREKEIKSLQNRLQQIQLQLNKKSLQEEQISMVQKEILTYQDSYEDIFDENCRMKKELEGLQDKCKDQLYELRVALDE